MIYSAWNRHGRRPDLPSWQIALILVLALSLGIAFAIVATGIFLISLPVAALAVLAYRLFGTGRGRRRGDNRVIEGEYEILDGAHPARSRGPDRR
ncbi:MAG TPA: hypothetical protein VIF14_14045 [Alphaproteobacteria bacterium]|jgi:hypothetical protein